MRLPRLTTRRLMVLVGITAVAMVGIQSRNSWIVLFSAEMLMVSVPTAMIAPERETPLAIWILSLCLLAMLALPIAFLLMLEIQHQLHGYTLP